MDVPEAAKEISRGKFPDDPISLVKGKALPGFEGALMKAPAGKKGWGIFYNSDVRSEGRIRFTQAHEFGHYLLHRTEYPDGIQCSSQDMVRWDSEYRQIEQQANEFAATLLMPFDDYRRQVDAQEKPSLQQIDACAQRYGVSLMAATLRWLEYTEQRVVMAVSRDDFILWGRSSSRALRSGKYFKTSGRSPIPVPNSSVAAKRARSVDDDKVVNHPPNVWFDEPCDEIAVVSDQFDFVMSLLFLDRDAPRYDGDEEEVEDVSDRFGARNPGSSWLE